MRHRGPTPQRRGSRSTLALQEARKSVWELPPDSAPVVTAELAAHLKQLWVDPGLQSVFERRNEFYFPESAATCVCRGRAARHATLIRPHAAAARSFYGEIDRIADADYVPSVKDVLLSRTRTAGIFKEEFNMSGLSLMCVAPRAAGRRLCSRACGAPLQHVRRQRPARGPAQVDAPL